MPLRIVAPTSTLYNPLLENAAQAEGVHLLRAREEECAHLLAANRVDVALVSPLTYGRAVGTAEYRILPTTTLALEGYTEHVWLYFRPGLRTLTRCAVPSCDAFLTQALRILLLEAYDLEPTLFPANSDVPTSLTTADAVLSWEEDLSELPRMDVGEEWYTTFGYALPVALWVCRMEELPRELPHMLEQLARPGLPAVEAVTESEPLPALPPRTGRLLWRWSDTVAAALRETLNLLYYHGLVPHIAEVKLWSGEP
jgi:predicted solute-binding protein